MFDDLQTMIPKIVHQTWKTRHFEYWVFKKSQASVHEHLGQWEYRLWSDSDLDAFVHCNYREFYPSWKSLNAKIKQVDVARYFLLHKFGGLYADLDFIFTRTPEDLLDGQHRMYFYISQQAIVKKWQFLGNALMISMPGEQFWMDLVEHMFRLPEDTPVLHHTGPRAIGAYYAALGGIPAIKVFGPEIFDNDRCADGVGLHSYGYHMRAATWQRPNEKVT